MCRIVITAALTVAAILVIGLPAILSAQPAIQVDVSSIEVVVSPGESHQETFNIINVGNAALSYECDFTFPGDQPRILVVDDDGGVNNGGSYFDVQRFYTAALDSLGLEYDVYVVDWSISPEQPGPDAETMSDYDLVIWFNGEAWGYYGNDTITPTDEGNLAIFLDGGGSLFLSSQDYFYDAYTNAGSFSTGQFPYDYLGITFTQQDLWAPPISCAGGLHSFATGLSYQCAVPYPSSTMWTDMLQGAGEPLLTVDFQAAALQYETATFKSAFTTLSFEGMVDGSSTKAQFMQGLTDWVQGRISGIFETDDPWLFLEPAVGSVAPQESQLITATFQMPDTAEVGDSYEGTIIIENNSPTNPVTIPVLVLIEAGVRDAQSQLPVDFALHQNYPNPFNPTTTIRFDLPNATFVEVSVFDLLGRKVATLVRQRTEAGSHYLTFDGATLPSGIYFYRIKTDQFADTKKMIVMK